MAKEIFTLGRDAIDQIRSLIRDERSRIGNPEGHRGRWMQTLKTPCPNRHILSINGNPTSGTIDIEIDGQAVQLDWDMTTTEIETEINTAVTFATGSAVVKPGGPLPNHDITIDLPHGLTFEIMNTTVLTGGTGSYARLVACCGD